MPRAQKRQHTTCGIIKAGVGGTPAFPLGFVETDGKVKAAKKIVRAQPYASFKAVWPLGIS